MKSLHEREGKFQNDTIQLSLTQIMESAKEGLLALAVQTGLQVFQAMMQEEVTQLAGPKENTTRIEKRFGTGWNKGLLFWEDEKFGWKSPGFVLWRERNFTWKCIKCFKILLC